MNSPNFVVIVRFSRLWMLAWEVSDSLGWASVTKFLENHPSFSLRKFKERGAHRYAVRTERRGENTDWILSSHPNTEPVDDCWPDVKKQ